VAGNSYWFSTGGDPLEPYYAQTEDALGIPRGTLKGIVSAENTAPGVTSSAGAQTQFQILPTTAKDLGVNLSDDKSAMQGAAKYWKQMFDTFGDPGLAYAAYNFGPGNVQSYLKMKKPFPGGVQQYMKTGLGQSRQGSDYVSSYHGKPFEDTALAQTVERPTPIPLLMQRELGPLPDPTPPPPAEGENPDNKRSQALLLSSLQLLLGGLGGW
jgi:hypothetical protein